MKRIAAGDRGAFETVYYRYGARLGTYVARVVKRPDLVGEVMNDVMLAVWQNARRFDGERPLGPWLYGIAHLKALKALEWHDRHSGRETQEPPADNAVDEAAGHDESMDLERDQWQRDLARVLGRALADLPPEQRSVVELTYYADLGYEAIAILLECPVNTIKTRMFHARRRLREVLGRMGINGVHDA